MSKTPRHLRWLVGGVVGISLLSACGAPEQQSGDSLDVSAPEATAGEVSVKVSVGTSSLAAKDDVQVTVTLTNVSGHAVRLLKRNTPVDGIKNELFSVTRDGAAVAYIGRHYKWAAPQAEDFLTLGAGESVTRTVSLSGIYEFTQTGSYAIAYAEANHEGTAQFTSNSVNVWVEGRANTLPEESGERVVSDFALSTTGCTTSQASGVSSGFSGAKTYATNALSYLTNTTPSGTARYTTWFGTYSSSGWSTIKSHFSSISSAFNNQSVVVSCACTDSAYAYVYANQPYKIYVCNAFWSAPTTGTDSKAGTLVHEMSHFTVVAGTDDWAYGQSAAKSLAKSNPTNARDNADSHEYFAENTPAQN
ncbi:M35 family metallo-endopeptidase [Hyalangium versicolor]|uniref:M35 family metallo-endopeptidase n=1 Tax=Hyalangium versicolor TaxID=2861190 RepID=UPI001CCC8C28|nr:M35 family metallo-endopeptidase [Hyalangium versicolor]